MSIQKGKFLSNTAMALTISFLSSCATNGVNDNVENETSLMQASEKAAKSAINVSITEDEGKTLISPPFLPPIAPKKMKESNTLPFSDAIEEAKENAKQTPIDGPSIFIQDYTQPEEP